MRYEFIACSIIGFILEILCYFFWPTGLWGLVVLLPLFVAGVYDIFQKKHTLLKNYPLLGRLRYWMEELRPKIYQYFIESDIDGAPINRIHRSVVYQRAKRALSTSPFGTQVNVYESGYEWINHSMNPVDHHEIEKKLRVKIGGFAHNTGEGSLSPFHLKHGGDLIWQIGTGYFGCRTKEGKFCAEKFKEKATLEQVKMIEIKISQGAKPGHGGILPARKNTPEIAEIRGVEPHIDILSPPMHTAFSNARELLQFIDQLRQLSGGKPIGFKLCFGRLPEFKEICQLMLETGIRPDFITVDGGEGGTGAAPIEFADSIGTPLKEGLTIVHDLLVAYDLKNEIKIIASGRVITGFDLVKNLALGADLCNSARAMMLALGCIQALLCNTNKCPAGIATQDPMLQNGLDVTDKGQRVANFHDATIESVAEILGAAGIKDLALLERKHIYRRVGPADVRSFEDIYPYRQNPSLRNVNRKEG